MLHVPIVRQPDDVTCLPSRVRSVLAYHGQEISGDDAEGMCRTHEAGSRVTAALDGLADAGVDADLLQLSGIEDLQDALTEGRPVIALLRHPSGGYHAVVVCDVTPNGVVVMDPAPGDYVTISLPRFEAVWGPLHHEAILVGAKLPT